MAKPRWQDTTSYSQNDTTRTPTVWALTVGVLTVKVHRWHGLQGWYGTCYMLDVERYALKAVDVAAAQQEFLGYLKQHLAKFSTALQQMCR